ncbi:hypothetical protein Hdeb2414_s0020g00567621 [Helianthus debilis subsp. tardiflorus]
MSRFLLHQILETFNRFRVLSLYHLNQYSFSIVSQRSSGGGASIEEDVDGDSEKC